MWDERDVPDRRDVAELIELVHAEPLRAADCARERLDADDWADEDEHARLYWVVGLAEREQGHLDDAREALEKAEKLANGGDADLLSRIRSSLAFVLARQGDLDSSYDLLLAAEPEAGTLQRARLLAQRGVVAHLRGELTDAAEMLTTACHVLKRHGDRIAEARHRANLGAVLGELGRYASSRRQLRRAITVAEQLGLDVVVGIAHSTLGYMATLRGDLPGALWEYSEAEHRFERSGATSYLGGVHLNHARALADAGLFDDAEQLLARALDMFRSQGQHTELANGLLTAAEIRLARNDLDGVRAAAGEAATSLREQRRTRWVALAVSLTFQAKARALYDAPPEDHDHRLPAALERAADALSNHGWRSESIRARLTAAKLRAEYGTARGRTLVSEQTRRQVAGGRAADRVLLAYVDALTAEQAGDRGAARRAITRGLSTVRSAQSVLGTIETRAHAAHHGCELIDLGARLAIADHRPRELLARIEATRLMLSRTPAVRPPEDHRMAAMLVELRSLDVRIADVSTPPSERAEAEHRRFVLERQVRRHARCLRGDAGVEGGSFERELHDAITLLGDRQLLAHAALDGELYAVSIRAGRARLDHLGPVAAITPVLDSLAFALHRLSRDQGSQASRRAAAELLDDGAAELVPRLLPRSVAAADVPLVVVPTAVLHDVPWALLPALRGRPVSVNPSVSAWAQAEASRRQRNGLRGTEQSAAFVAGPELDHAEREVNELASLYPGASVVTGPGSTVATCLELLGSVDVMHVACHGSFRTDNPMFSSLHLADGKLVVYDLERLSRLPDVVVLSACNTATAKVLQGRTVLGLASALTAIGACSVIAPLAPISDAAAVTAMAAIHDAMVSGLSPAAALAHAASGGGDTGVTAASFVALGA